MSESKEKLEPEEKASEQEQAESTQKSAETTASEYEEYEPEELRKLLAEKDAELNKLQEEVSELKDTHLRKAAELENFRKRVKRERSQIYETAKANALDDFLHINDDLQRTLSAAEELDVNETFLDGVLLVANKFEEVLDKHGVERIDKEGVPFDVDLHDAMMRQKPEDDNIESDTVLNVIENGYRIGDRTIRHAKVIVSE